MNLTKKIITSCLIVVSLVALSACHTVGGFGKDVSKTGKEIQKVSR